MNDAFVLMNDALVRMNAALMLTSDAFARMTGRTLGCMEASRWSGRVPEKARSVCCTVFPFWKGKRSFLTCCSGLVVRLSFCSKLFVFWGDSF